MSKQGYDVGPLRSILDGLLANKTISQDERDSIINYIAAADTMDDEAIAEAGSLATERDQVIDALAKTINRHVGPQEEFEPTQPLVEKAPTLETANQYPFQTE